MSQHYQLSVQFQDTSYFSLIRGLEEILEKLKQDEEKIQFGEKLTYESSYADEPDNGKYLTTIETIKR
ncbi:MAG: hypothetical protein GY734_21835 [Herbaspirillum sp.]|uniref:hypothetical protein n=1 Tax=Herbaspirillum sp. TaxID=1890675 RepID=UPI00258F4F39|nr:hypothetical protein [Herbaspirillum sp.]MCP3658508.1 hypothetical protein [Herbaspirillum sp.]MCP4033861.1 hypothetical protein [Herbaspirillum sp.]